MNVIPRAVCGEHLPAEVSEDPAEIFARARHDFRPQPGAAIIGREDKVIIQLRVRHPEFLSPPRGLLPIGRQSGGCARRLASPPAKSFWPLRGEERKPVTGATVSKQLELQEATRNNPDAKTAKRTLVLLFRLRLSICFFFPVNNDKQQMLNTPLKKSGAEKIFSRAIAVSSPRTGR